MIEARAKKRHRLEMAVFEEKQKPRDAPEGAGNTGSGFAQSCHAQAAYW